LLYIETALQKVAPKSGNSRKIREFLIFNRGKSGENEIFFRKSGKIREVSPYSAMHSV